MVDIGQLITASIVDAISGIISNVFYIILLIWAVKTIVKQVPSWLEQYDKIKMKHYNIDSAIKSRRSYL